MPNPGNVEEILSLLFETATDTRKFEIDLFWKRSLFFWGFISVAFVGFASVKDNLLALVLSCFGLTCSVIWTLGNRGGKYWQEAWEAKVERIEAALPRSVLTDSLRPLFDRREPSDTTKGWWLRGRQFSVSKLTIALSDFTSVLWFALFIHACVVIGKERLPYWSGWEWLPEVRQWDWIAFPASVLSFLALALWKGQTTPPKAATKAAPVPSASP